MGRRRLTGDDGAGAWGQPSAASLLPNRVYLGLAVPFMFSTVTQPLLGAVDTAVIGMLGDTAAIAGVSLGANLFNTLYWLFGFLRVSTTGHSAQVQEHAQRQQRSHTFFLPLMMSGVIAACFLVLQGPMLSGYLAVTRPEAEVVLYVSHYYRILIWGAPFVLTNYVMLGWLMGQQRIRDSLFMQISGNVVNMVLDYWFVCGLGLGIQGVAAATLISQVYTCVCGGIAVHFCGRFGKDRFKNLWNGPLIWKMIRENRDLMLRTICLVGFNNLFVTLGARLGTDILAVNAILIQITSIQAYLFEGIANGSSVFAGKAAGTRDDALMEVTVRRTWQWGFITAAVMGGASILSGDLLFRIFTPIDKILELADRYKGFCWLYPFVAAAGLCLYGIYTGSSMTRPVFLSTMWACFISIPVCIGGTVLFGNVGLWVGYLTFYGGRSLGLIVCQKQLWGSLSGKGA